MYLHAVNADTSGRHVDGSLLVVVQGQAEPVEVRLPGRPWAARYALLWDSSFEQPPGRPRGPRTTIVPAGDVVEVAATSVQIFGARPPQRKPAPRPTH
jgi:hypothetical protein